MSRKVYISSEISIDEKLAAIAESEPIAALIWPHMLTALDDWGRAEAAPRRLKMLVFPGNPLVTHELIASSLQLYAQAELTIAYESAGKRYFAIPDLAKWFKYQSHIRGDKRLKDYSSIPAPAEHLAYYEQVNAEIAQECAQSEGVDNENQACSVTLDTVVQSHNIAQHRVQSTELLCNRTPSPSPSPSPSAKAEEREDSCASANPDDAIESDELPKNEEQGTLQSRFERWWEAYPRKRSKGDAQKAWNVLKPDASMLASMLAALEWQRKSPDWDKQAGQFVPYPATYLRAKGWEDQPDIDAAAEPPRKRLYYVPPEFEPPSAEIGRHRGLAA